MQSKNVNKILLVLAVIVVIAILAFLVFALTNVKPRYSFKGDSYLLNVNYTDNDKWNYDLKVEKPSPCHKLEMSRNLKSENEYVLSISIQEDPLVDCAQVIEDYTETGIIDGPKSLKFFVEFESDTQQSNFKVNSSTKSITKEDFLLQANYLGNNSWEYMVSGYKPTPCHVLEIDALVAESFPEQVSVELKISEPENKDLVCSQVLAEFSEQGTFQASENATFDLVLR